MKQCLRLGLLLHLSQHYQKHQLVPELEGQTLSLQLFSSFLLPIELQDCRTAGLVLVALAESLSQGNTQGFPTDTW